VPPEEHRDGVPEEHQDVPPEEHWDVHRKIKRALSSRKKVT
jgi:hypothetical protein